jgi:addiction module HigA family antidote
MMEIERKPTHPGEVLREIVFPSLDTNISKAARDMQMSRQLLHGILREEKNISPESAVKIGKYIGNGAGLWLRMQTTYDLYVAERSMQKIVSAIPVANHI